jgi:hypothetical protein
MRILELKSMFEYLFISVTASAIHYAQNEGRNCFAFNPVNPKSFFWQECTHALVPMCAHVKYIFNHYIN